MRTFFIWIFITIFLYFVPSPSFWYRLSDGIILEENIFLMDILSRFQIILLHLEEHEQIKQLSAHFVLIGCCSFFACREAFKKNKKLDYSKKIIVLFIILFIIFFSTLVEYGQSALPTSFDRSFDWMDIIFSLLGGLTGILIFLFRNRMN